MDGQPTKIQSKTDTQKSKDGRQEAEGSRPSEQVTIPRPGSAPEPVLRRGTADQGRGGSPAGRTLQHHGKQALE